MVEITPEFGTIVFPAGACGNHLRWLLFLDEKFITPFSNNNINDKLKFIKDSIYTTDRTWNTWLTCEFKYRSSLDRLLDVKHDFAGVTGKKLFLKAFDVNLPADHYFHINLGMNSMSPELYKIVLGDWNQSTKQFERSSDSKILCCDPLFNETLDQGFYQSVIEFFKFDNHYPHAQDVHKLYYETRKKSLQDFHKYFSGPSFQEYLIRIENGKI